MIKITVFLSVLIIPLTSLGQETVGNHCNSKQFSSDSKNVEIKELENELEKLENELEIQLDKRNLVIICFQQQYESPGHGIFGLVDWNERKIAEIEIKKYTNGESPVFTADGKGLTVQKAPLGTWHAKDGSAIKSWFAPSYATSVDTVLSSVVNASDLLDFDRGFSAKIMTVE